MIERSAISGSEAIPAPNQPRHKKGVDVRHLEELVRIRRARHRHDRAAGDRARLGSTRAAGAKPSTTR
jgi:hypothetical protein